MEIHVIRHTSVASGKELCYGQYDVVLADTFSEEVVEIKGKLSNDFDAIYCSPLLRCKILAESLHLPNIIYENDLKEINFGSWENIKWNDINQEELGFWMEDFVNRSPPEGEKLIELYKRVESFLDQLSSRSLDKVLIISHAGVIRCMWSYILEVPLANIFKIPIGHGELFTFNLDKNKPFTKIKQKQ
jgi:alpha-ribazole phosphatase